MTAKVSLSQLKPSESGIISEILLEDRLSSRLADMGIVQGASLKVLRFAPFGDPIECISGNCRIAVRKKEAKHIILERVNCQ